MVKHGKRQNIMDMIRRGLSEAKTSEPTYATETPAGVHRKTSMWLRWYHYYFGYECSFLGAEKCDRVFAFPIVGDSYRAIMKIAEEKADAEYLAIQAVKQNTCPAPEVRSGS